MIKRITLNGLGEVYLPRVKFAQQRMDKMLVYMVQNKNVSSGRYYDMKNSLYDLSLWHLELREIRPGIIEVTPYWYDGEKEKDMGNRTTYNIDKPETLNTDEGLLTYYFWTGRKLISFPREYIQRANFL